MYTRRITGFFVIVFILFILVVQPAVALTQEEFNDCRNSIAAGTAINCVQITCRVQGSPPAETTYTTVFNASRILGGVNGYHVNTDGGVHKFEKIAYKKITSRDQLSDAHTCIFDNIPAKYCTLRSDTVWRAEVEIIRYYSGGTERPQPWRINLNNYICKDYIAPRITFDTGARGSTPYRTGDRSVSVTITDDESVLVDYPANPERDTTYITSCGYIIHPPTETPPTDPITDARYVSRPDCDALETRPVSEQVSFPVTYDALDPMSVTVYATDSEGNRAQRTQAFPTLYAEINSTGMQAVYGASHYCPFQNGCFIGGENVSGNRGLPFDQTEGLANIPTCLAVGQSYADFSCHATQGLVTRSLSLFANALGHAGALRSTIYCSAPDATAFSGHPFGATSAQPLCGSSRPLGESGTPVGPCVYQCVLIEQGASPAITAYLFSNRYVPGINLAPYNIGRVFSPRQTDPQAYAETSECTLTNGAYNCNVGDTGVTFRNNLTSSTFAIGKDVGKLSVVYAASARASITSGQFLALNSKLESQLMAYISAIDLANPLSTHALAEQRGAYHHIAYAQSGTRRILGRVVGPYTTGTAQHRYAAFIYRGFNHAEICAYYNSRSIDSTYQTIQLIGALNTQGKCIQDGEDTIIIARLLESSTPDAALQQFVVRLKP